MAEGEAKGSNWRKWRGLVEVIQAAVLHSNGKKGYLRRGTLVLTLPPA